MKDLRSGIEHLKQAKAHMSEANGIMSNCISKLKFLEEENAELKAELDDWKGNAEGFQPDEYMKLPLDAGGKPIRIGDVLYLPDSPGSIVVSGYERSTYSDEVYCIGYQDGRKSHFCPKLWTHKQPGPADSWEKLEEDAAKEVCAYAGASFSIVDQDRYSCTGCRFDDCSSRKTSCWLQMNSELMARAKKLAGIEGEAQR